MGILATIMTVPIIPTYLVFAHYRQKAYKDLGSDEASWAGQEVSIISANEFGTLMRCPEMRM